MRVRPWFVANPPPASERDRRAAIKTRRRPSTGHRPPPSMQQPAKRACGVLTATSRFVPEELQRVWMCVSPRFHDRGSSTTRRLRGRDDNERRAHEPLRPRRPTPAGGRFDGRRLGPRYPPDPKLQTQRFPLPFFGRASPTYVLPIFFRKSFVLNDRGVTLSAARLPCGPGFVAAARPSCRAPS